MRYDIFLSTILQYAGGIANRYFGNVKGTTKAEDHNQVVTKADLGIGNYINAQLQKDYPAYNIIDEEAGGVYSDFFGQPMDYSDSLTKVKDNFTVCAGAPILHKQLQEIIHGSISRASSTNT